MGCCSVEDMRDGSYRIRLTARVAGEVRVCARVDSVELPPVTVVFEERVVERQAERRLRLRPARLAAAHALAERGVNEEGLREHIVQLAELW